MHQPISEPTTSFEHGLTNQQSSRQLIAGSNSSEPCFFCSEGEAVEGDLTSLIPEALFSKYASSQNYFYTKQLNDIVEDGLSLPCARYRENLMLDDEEEYLKREYSQQEYERKIGMLSQYYKFHKDFPRFYGLPIELAMGKYHDNRRDFDYRRIRKMLKEQQKMDFQDSEPSEMSDSLVNHSSYVKKSRYSTMLEALQQEFERSRNAQNDQSNALLDTLHKLDNIVKSCSNKLPTRLRLLRNTNDEASIERNKFDNFLKKAERRPIPKLKLSTHRKSIPTSSIKSPNIKLDFRKKKAEKSEEKILVPTRRQDDNIMKRLTNTYNSTGMHLPIKSIQINDLTKPSQPLSVRVPATANQNNETLKRHSMNSKELFDTIKSSTSIKPLLKNFDIMTGLDFGGGKSKRARREKSIQKIYGVKMRSVSMGNTDRTEQNNLGMTSHKKSKQTLDSAKKSSKSSQNLRQYRSKEYTKSTEPVSRSPCNSLRKSANRSSKVSLTSSKKSLPKLDSGQYNYTAMSKELKKFDSVFSSSKNDNRDTVDRMLQKKMKVEPSPSINFLRLRSLI